MGLAAVAARAEAQEKLLATVVLEPNRVEGQRNAGKSQSRDPGGRRPTSRTRHSGTSNSSGLRIRGRQQTYTEEATSRAAACTYVRRTDEDGWRSHRPGVLSTRAVLRL